MNQHGSATFPFQQDNACVGESGDHPCGGGGSSDGTCRHDDGSSHPCCQASGPEFAILDESLVSKN